MSKEVIVKDNNEARQLKIWKFKLLINIKRKINKIKPIKNVKN